MNSPSSSALLVVDAIVAALGVAVHQLAAPIQTGVEMEQAIVMLETADLRVYVKPTADGRGIQLAGVKCSGLIQAIVGGQQVELQA